MRPFRNGNLEAIFEYICTDMTSKSESHLHIVSSSRDMFKMLATAASPTEATPSYSLQHPAHVYQTLLENRKLTSEALVNQFLDQIERHNTSGLELKAIISVCPRQIALTHARALDQERQNGRLRSDLHGIPIILKVTQPRMSLLNEKGVM